MTKIDLVRRILLVAAVLAILVAPAVVHAAPPTPETSAGAPPLVGAPPIQGEPTTVVASSGLRLREGPSTYDPIILILRNGETVYPSAGPVWNQGISWTYVGVYRWGYYYEGFCASKYLANYGSSVPSGGGGVRVTARPGLRLRWGPGLWYGINRVVAYGTILEPTGTSQWGSGLQWVQVYYGGHYLWAAGAYLTPV